jgi:hypothetical protein
MKGIPVIRLKQLKRTAVMAGAVSLIAGASVLGATQAHAAAPVLGTQPGGVTLNPPSGSTTATGIQYNSTACPSGFQGSGELLIVDPATGGPTSGQSALAAVNNSVAAPFSGTITDQALFLEATAIFTDIAGGPAAEMVMACFSGPSATGNESFVQDEFITITADGSSYTTSSTGGGGGGPTATTTHLSVNPSQVEVGQTTTLTASVSPSNAAGTVQFEVGGTASGGPVTVSGGTASMTTPPFAASGTVAVSAVFTPTDSTAFGSSQDTGSVTVVPVGTQTGTIPLSVNVPNSGAFTLNVDTADTVTLAVSGSSATASTTPIVVTDTRNSYPGWSVSGKANQFVGSGTAAGAFMSGDQLGWMPTSTGTLPQGVTLGGAVTPASPGLGTTPAVLASVHAGLNNGVGTTTLGADLTLAIPTGQAAGPYGGGLVITAVDSNP